MEGETSAGDQNQGYNQGVQTQEEESGINESSKPADWLDLTQKFGTDFQKECIPGLSTLLTSEDPLKLIQGCYMIRRLLSEENSPAIQEVIDCNYVPLLLQAMQHPESTQIQYEAAWSITNVVSGQTQQVMHVLDNGGLPIILTALHSEIEMIREQAMWALGNIAGDSVFCRDTILQENVMPTIIENVTNSPKESLKRNGIWLLSNLIRGRPSPPFHMVRQAVPIMAHVLKTSQNPEIINDACWAFSVLSDGNHEQITSTIESGVIPRMVDLLAYPQTGIQIPALRTVGNVCTGTEGQTQIVLDQGLLKQIAKIIDHESKSVRREIMWTLSNITAGSQFQLQQFLSVSDLVQQICTRAIDDDLPIRREAVWVISNATNSGQYDDIVQLINAGAIPALCSLLDCTQDRPVLVALEGIGNILDKDIHITDEEKSFGRILCQQEDSRVKLEALQFHGNVQISSKAGQIQS